jgi:hypothetical protein
MPPTISTANAFNQYGRCIGDGQGDTDEQAIAAAKQAARQTIVRGNPNWKWRIASVRVHHEPRATSHEPG